ncbi:hypothetical protein PF391_002614 [Salmonella enterica]|nr:hypothetical protein [Salmonella enterica]
MKLYIANTTKQRHDFAWRKPETGRLVYHPINAGSQAVVIDGTRAEIDQNRIYIGLCYSIDKPVASKVIEKAMRDNDGHLNRAAHDRRQASVLATNNALTEQENGYLGELEVSAEQRLSATDDRDETAFVDETLAVNTGTKKKK